MGHVKNSGPVKQISHFHMSRINFEKSMISLADQLDMALHGFGPEVYGAYIRAFNRWLVLDMNHKPIYLEDPAVSACKFLGVL